jgi:drug/metabolite transporter (DMT)-like permease
VVWALGLGGLFGYHALYFAALRMAPPAESGLINYLWPLLIVLFSSFLPGERLKPAHIAGAVLGFAGVALLIAGRGGLDARAEYIPGYLCAFVASFVWAGYSVLSRRFGQVPTDAVAGFCLATSGLSLLCHLAFETTVWPETPTQWLALLALGIGPVGAAFYVWDVGMKRGDIRLLGVASYATPVLSTLILVAAGYAEPSWILGLSCGLIVAGALVATLMGKRATGTRAAA